LVFRLISLAFGIELCYNYFSEGNVMKSKRCGLCGITTRAHKKANFKPARSGRSGLKLLKPRSSRVRKWDVVDSN